MKPSLQLRINQNLTTTPQLQHAIRLLQLSSVELQAEIQDALGSNMMLKLDDMYEVIDGLISKFDRQLIKHKKKLANHHKNNNSKGKEFV